MNPFIIVGIMVWCFYIAYALFVGLREERNLSEIARKKTRTKATRPLRRPS